MTPDPTVSPETPASPATAPMRALVGRTYGPADGLSEEAVARPEPGKGEVLVRVHAAGVSRAALHLLTGKPYLIRLAGFGVRAPKQPVVGNELAGVVEAVGPDVVDLQVGDEVFGYGWGSCAELAVGKAAKLAHKPASVSFVDAAATVDSASTAIQAVRDHAAVQAGQRVLVLGGSGGVGSFVVQIAASLGAEVTATASTAKLDFVRDLGAAHVVDHSSEDPLTVDQPFDVIIDIGGNRPVRQLRKALAADGTLVFVGGEAGGPLTGGFQRQILAPLRAIGSSQRLKAVMATEHRASLEDLAALIEAGSLRPAVDRTHSLADGAAAFRRMEAGEIRGKDVIVLEA